MKMLLAGGGTGGHLFPAVAIAEQWLQQDENAEVRFVGTAKGLEAKLLPKLGLALETIDMVGLVGRGLSGALQVLPKLFRSLRQSQRILQQFKPDIVVGVGGYSSFPVLTAAWLKGIPFIVHEQNAQFGLSNRVLARFAQRVCVSLPESAAGLPQQKVVVTGNPLRQEVAGLSSALPPAGKLLVFGGSRGAHAINQLMVEALPLLRRMGVDAAVVHQTGQADQAQVTEAYRAAGETRVEVFAFIDDMATAYRNAQLVVSRAGATTIAELCACGRPALLIPFPHAAADHQTANAAAMQATGAAKLLVQAELTPEILAATIGELLPDRAQLQQMAQAAKVLGQTDAAERVVAVCIDILSEG